MNRPLNARSRALLPAIKSKSNIASNQGKLEVVKQEMARLNIDILGISELKWTGMGEFNSDNDYVYYLGKNSLEEME